MAERERQITENLGLVHSCCHRFAGKGVEYDDLFQAGCIGLIKAVDNFDAERGVCFSTYAVPSILGEIRRIFRDGGTVKVSRSLKELAIRAKRMDESLRAEGKEVTLSLIAGRLNVEPAEVAEALASAQPTVSLTTGEDEAPLEIPMADGSEKLVESLALQSAVNGLEERDRRIIELRYFGTRTQTQTAGELGMTQVQVSRREKKILTYIREKMQM